MLSHAIGSQMFDKKLATTIRTLLHISRLLLSHSASTIDIQVPYTIAENHPHIAPLEFHHKQI
jgi:hypothetical protein